MNDADVINMFVRLFSQLPNSENDQYTVLLKKTVIENDLYSYNEDLEHYLSDVGNTQFRFAAFYALLIIARQKNNYTSYNSIVDRYGDEFYQEKLYKIVLSTYYRNKFILGEKTAYRLAIKNAEDACSILPSNLAVKHHFAELVALVCEENETKNQEQIDLAISRLDDVIVAFPKHAKYYSTRGRLFAFSGKWMESITDIRKALDLEVADDKESLVRIGQYNYYLLQARMLMESDGIDSKIKGFNSEFKMIERDLDSLKTQYLEYLAFFSSVLAFILATVNILTQVDDFSKCAGLILMFSGSLITVFMLFRMLISFSAERKHGRFALCFCIVMGIFLMACGYLVGNHYIDSVIAHFVPIQQAGQVDLGGT